MTESIPIETATASPTTTPAPEPVAASSRMKEHWVMIKKIAKWLDVKPQQLHRIWGRIPKAEQGEFWRFANFGGSAEMRLAYLAKFQEYAAARRQQPQLRVHNTDSNVLDNVTKVVSSDLGLAMWFIRKIGDVDRAEDIFKLAAQTIRKALPPRTEN